MSNDDLIDAVRAALDTDETGENLVSVAMAAHDAEQRLALLLRMQADDDVTAYEICKKLEEWS